MLLLKNIEINDKTASADFIPEDSKISGHIIVDLVTEEILETEHVSGFEFMYPGHARQRLVEMAKAHDARKTCRVMWF